jgi:uncharacterized delta-60 repeat protein
MDTRERPAFRPLAEGLESRQLLTAGDLDLTFGTGGSVLTSPNVESKTAGYYNNDAIAGPVIQPDGKVLVGGFDSVGDWGLVRLTNTGALDPTFDSDGRVLTGFPVMDSGNRPNNMVLQADGKIVVSGVVLSSKITVRGQVVYNYDFGVVRYLPGGALDPSFGPGGTGRVTTNISTYSSTGQSNQNDWSQALAIQPDGKILVGGYSQRDATTRNASMVRYNADGTLDGTFGVGGKVVSYFSSVANWIKDLQVLPDGKILALGSTFIARYNPNGTLDTTSGFGAGGAGFSTVSFGSSSTAMLGMALQRDGSGILQDIVVTGWGSNGGTTYIALARFTPSGVLDTTFGGTGIITHAPGGNDIANRVYLLPDGKILVTGQSNPNGGSAITLAARFLPDGSYDPSFGTGGAVLRNFGATGSAFRGSRLQPDGTLVAVGLGSSAHNGSTDNNFLIVRYLGDPVTAPATAAPRLLAQPSNPTPQATESLVPVAPPADQALTLLATELLRSGRKSFRPSLKA